MTAEPKYTGWTRVRRVWSASAEAVAATGETDATIAPAGTIGVHVINTVNRDRIRSQVLAMLADQRLSGMLSEATERGTPCHSC
ncbi:hypothetical protein ABTY98_03090 [Streptomyces sp. NPDC096040]|uniref:hypothetical protein n=1 Tax=Streptomyces sp. NPDC096040 TaxID=3155541 RepID=UPI003329B71E